MGKVKGIGGVFIKAKDVTFLAAWYPKHLGIEFGDNSYVYFKCPPEPERAGLNRDLNTPVILCSRF